RTALLGGVAGHADVLRRVAREAYTAIRGCLARVADTFAGACSTASRAARVVRQAASRADVVAVVTARPPAVHDRGARDHPARDPSARREKLVHARLRILGGRRSGRRPPARIA